MVCSSAVKRALALVVLLFAAAFVHAEGIEVRSAALQPREDGYVLEADIDISLGSTLEDILNKGVPLNFLLEFELTRPRWYWLNDRVVTFAQPYKLSYNALTRQYRISLGTLFQHFGTLAEALSFMSRVRNLPVADRAVVRKDNVYTATLRLRLDVSQLPRPFQLSALGSKEWNLGSDWFRFGVTP